MFNVQALAPYVTISYSRECTGRAFSMLLVDQFFDVKCTVLRFVLLCYIITLEKVFQSSRCIVKKYRSHVRLYCAHHNV